MTPKAGRGRFEAPSGREPVRARVGLPVWQELGAAQALAEAEYARPKTRADCLAGGSNAPRPCPWVSCAAHLALDVRDHGSYATVKESFPGVEVWEMAETCALDVADRGGVTAEEVAALLNLTVERARKVEALAVERVAAGGVGE